MEESFNIDNFNTTISGYNDDVVIDHNEYYGMNYMYESGKSFVEICRDMGLDDDNIPFRVM